MDQDQKARLGGLFLIGAGALLGYLAIWRPYQAALAGAPTVSLQRTGIALAIIFPLLGAILIAGGEAVSNHIKAQTTGKKTKLGWAYLVVVGGVAIGIYLAVESKFKSLGYTI